MKKNIIPTGVLVAMLWSCQKENLPEIQPSEPASHENKTKVRSRENVESIVLDLFHSQSLRKEASTNPIKKPDMEISVLTSSVLSCCSL